MGPLFCAGASPAAHAEGSRQAIAAPRRLLTNAVEIAELFSMPRSTTSAVLARTGLGKSLAA